MVTLGFLRFIQKIYASKEYYPFKLSGVWMCQTLKLNSITSWGKYISKTGKIPLR